MLKCDKGHNLKAIYYNFYLDKVKHSYYTIKNRKYCVECDKLYRINMNILDEGE